MFQIRSRRLDVSSVLSAVGDPAAGAIVVFTGTTRRTNAGRRVVRLEYEACVPAGGGCLKPLVFLVSKLKEQEQGV